MKATPQRLPRSRRERLIIKELPDETLVYDVACHTAHCLNATAAEVWRRCDGETGIPETIQYLEKTLGYSKGEPALWYSLEQLQKAQLLSEPIIIPEPAGGISRRTALHAIGLTAAAGLPVVISIVAPRAVQAGTCLPSGSACTTGAQCCSGICSNGKCQ